MYGEWKLATAPAAEPLTSTEAKLHIRVDGTTEDALITSLIGTCRQICEEYTWRSLITQTWDLYLPYWPHGRYIEIPRPPLQSVTHLKYTTSDGVLRTLDSSTYMLDTITCPARLWLKRDQAWPGDELQVGMPINVRYVAGYGAAAADVPEPIRHGMKLVLGHLYANRESVVSGSVNELPQAVEWLWTPYEVRW